MISSGPRTTVQVNQAKNRRPAASPAVLNTSPTGAILAQRMEEGNVMSRVGENIRKNIRTKTGAHRYAGPLIAAVLIVAVSGIVAAALAAAQLGGRAVVFYHPRPFLEPYSRSVVVGVDWYDGCNVRVSALLLHWGDKVGLERYEYATHIYCFGRRRVPPHLLPDVRP
jgi:hypothetical protein